jgi:hypothetical protein
MKNESDWYLGLAARSLRLDIKAVKSYCREHNYLPTVFYELVKSRKIVAKNKKIHVNRR